VINKFTEHPKSVGETYFTHFKIAFCVAKRLLFASMCQALHAILPFINPPGGTDIDSLIKFLDHKSPATRCKYNFEDKMVEKYHSDR
jgi:hypothetical protein